jgi:hypothetical protein
MPAGHGRGEGENNVRAYIGYSEAFQLVAVHKSVFDS